MTQRQLARAYRQKAGPKALHKRSSPDVRCSQQYKHSKGTTYSLGRARQLIVEGTGVVASFVKTLHRNTVCYYYDYLNHQGGWSWSLFGSMLMPAWHPPWLQSGLVSGIKVYRMSTTMVHLQDFKPTTPRLWSCGLRSGSCYRGIFCKGFKALLPPRLVQSGLRSWTFDSN